MRTSGIPTSKGFTLVEIVVVTAIIALMLTMAAGSFDFLFGEYALRADARAIGEHLKLAKGEALSSGQDVYIAYDLKKRTHWMWVWHEKDEELRRSRDDTHEWAVLFRRTLEDGVFFDSILFGQERLVTQDVATVRVTPLGTADHHVVNLRGEDGKVMSVTLNGITGVVTFYDTIIGPQEYLREYE